MLLTRYCYSWLTREIVDIVGMKVWCGGGEGMGGGRRKSKLHYIVGGAGGGGGGRKGGGANDIISPACFRLTTPGYSSIVTYTGCPRLRSMLPIDRRWSRCGLKPKGRVRFLCL